jgi:hypothetical protein
MESAIQVALSPSWTPFYTSFFMGLKISEIAGASLGDLPASLRLFSFVLNHMLAKEPEYSRKQPKFLTRKL